MLLMLVVPVCGSPATTNDDLELKITAGKLGGDVGIGVTFEAINNREATVTVIFMFAPLCLRAMLLPWIPLNIERTLQPHSIVRETCYFPVRSLGAVYATAGEKYNYSTHVERTGFHFRQWVFLNPITQE
jgi:hypothetical protein